MKFIFKSTICLIFTIILIYIFLIVNVIIYSKKKYAGVADAVLVLGAAQWNGRPSPILKERINHSIEIYNNKQAKYLLFTGGYGKNSPFAESIAARNYALKKGIAPEHILTENISTTTIENLYYGMKIGNAVNLRSYILVSDPMHMLRCIIIANYFDMTCWSSPTTTSKFISRSAKLKFACNEAYDIIRFIVEAYILRADVLTTRLFVQV